MGRMFSFSFFSRSIYGTTEIPKPQAVSPAITSSSSVSQAAAGLVPVSAKIYSTTCRSPELSEK